MELLESVNSNNKLYIDLEKMSNRMLFNEDNYENIINSLISMYSLNIHSKLFLAIDEIQYVRNIPSIVKYLYDHYNIKFILTGSSTYYLKNLFAESLAGRKKIFELYTLD
ncbi:MAG TPA: ATPase, partial [Bacteroidetes bacterium]|nr:ATPase [Bacteroidota bacterium]